MMWSRWLQAARNVTKSGASYQVARERTELIVTGLTFFAACPVVYTIGKFSIEVLFLGLSICLIAIHFQDKFTAQANSLAIKELLSDDNSLTVSRTRSLIATAIASAIIGPFIAYGLLSSMFYASQVIK